MILSNSGLGDLNSTLRFDNSAWKLSNSFRIAARDDAVWVFCASRRAFIASSHFEISFSA